MKNTILSAALITAQLLGFGASSIPAQVKKTEVIVTLNTPDGVGAYDYALKCATALTEQIPGAEYGYIYDTLLCGFSLTLPQTATTSLSACTFVDDVFGVAEYEALSYEEAKKLAAKAIGATQNATDGLTGDGVKVAVIDNSFDVTHPAFDVSVTETLELDEYAMQVGIPVRLNALRYVIDVQKFRHNAKIPYAFDYADHDTNVFDETADHGTHVAGIIGAAKTEADSMQGIAPGCQLLLMKIFADGAKTASDSALIAAMEDAVKLDADVINLSIGHYAASTDMSVIGLDKVIEKTREAGCIVVCAVGNHGVTTDRGNSELPLATYTDYGTVSAPASADETVAVASVDNAVIFGEHFKSADGEPYYFVDTNKDSGVTEKSFSECFNGKTLEYVAVPGIGDEADYNGLDVKGKLVLVQRGTIPFAEKANIAARHGALGAIIYNNVENEYAKMDLTGATIPAISTTLEEGMELLSKDKKEASFSTEYMYIENTDTAWEVSYFSSRGTTPSLTLKPDISAVGGQVYSTVNGAYGIHSGTSMASPQFAGTCALLIEKARRAGSETDVITAIMNSAAPVMQDNGVEFSPRAQGAGLVNIPEALAREIEITYAKNGKPKAELFDKLGDTFTLDVTIKNLTDRALEAKLTATLTSDGCTTETVNGTRNYYSTLTAEADKKSLITVDGKDTSVNRHSDTHSPYRLTLAAGEEKTVTLTFALDKPTHRWLEKVFVNGYFAEGFVYCESENSTVSLPYMGYIGDFAKAGITDGDAYKNESAMFAQTKFMVEIDDSFAPTGANIFAGGNMYDGGTVAFSPNGDGFADEIFFAATHIRNARNATATVYDENGEIIKTSDVKRITKTQGKDAPVVFYFSWDGGDGMYAPYKMPDGDYVFEVIYTLDYGENNTQKYTYNIKIDTVMPTLTEISLSGNTLTLKAEDNLGINGICLYEGNTADKTKLMEADGDAVFDISGTTDDIIYYEIIDEAYNVLVGRVSLSELRERSGK